MPMWFVYNRDERKSFIWMDIKLMQTSNRQTRAEQEAEQTDAVTHRELRAQALSELETQMTESVGRSEKVRKKDQKALETLLAKRVARRHLLETQMTQPMKLQQRRRRSLIVLAIVLLSLTCLGILALPPLVKSWSQPASSTSGLQHALNPTVTVSKSSEVERTASLFMSKMQ